MHALREGQTLSLAQRLPLPARVRKLVQHRLERLSARGRRLVAAAAVIGRQFDFALVQRAADMSEREAAEGVEELVRHRVLRGAGDGLEFSHDHIRNVATSDLPTPLRIALHRRVAESLEDVYAHDLAPTRSRSARTIGTARRGRSRRSSSTWPGGRPRCARRIRRPWRASRRRSTRSAGCRRAPRWTTATSTCGSSSGRASIRWDASPI